MKKGSSVLLSVLLPFSLLMTGSASAEARFAEIGGKTQPAYDHSSRTVEADTGRVYGASEQAKIDAALRQAMLAQEIEESAQPGELRIEGMMNGKPLYARTEVSTQESENGGAA